MPDFLKNLLKPLDGVKTYLAAGGLLALSVVHLLSGETDRAGELFALALGVFGIGHKIEKMSNPQV